MKIYVAGAFVDKENVKALMLRIVNELGHGITHDWTQESGEGKSGFELGVYLDRCAEVDFLAVRECDALVFLNHPETRGAHTEMGFAIALRKPVFVLNEGASKNIFFRLNSVITCHNFETLKIQLEGLDCYSDARRPLYKKG